MHIFLKSKIGRNSLKQKIFIVPGQSNILGFPAWNVCALCLSPKNTLAHSWLTIGQPTYCSLLARPGLPSHPWPGQLQVRVLAIRTVSEEYWSVEHLQLFSKYYIVTPYSAIVTFFSLDSLDSYLEKEKPQHARPYQVGEGGCRP